MLGKEPCVVVAAACSKPALDEVSHTACVRSSYAAPAAGTLSSRRCVVAEVIAFHAVAPRRAMSILLSARQPPSCVITAA